MEENMCPVCGVTHTHNTGILLNKRLRDIKHTVTGYGLCEKCDELNEEGYIALIAVNNKGGNPTLKPEDANRTGAIAHLKYEVFNKMFQSNYDKKQTMVFVEPELITKLEEMVDG